MAIALTLAACTTPENPVPTDEPDTPETPAKEVKDVLQYISTDGRAVTPGNPDAFGAEILSTNTKTASGPCLSTMP